MSKTASLEIMSLTTQQADVAKDEVKDNTAVDVTYN